VTRDGSVATEISAGLTFFLFSKAFRTPLGPTQRLIHFLPWSFQAAKRSGLEIVHSPSSGDVVPSWNELEQLCLHFSLVYEIQFFCCRLCVTLPPKFFQVIFCNFCIYNVKEERKNSVKRGPLPKRCVITRAEHKRVTDNLKRHIFNLGLLESLRCEDNIKMDHREVGGGHGRYRFGSG
jgi:hypothetical protein